MSDVQPTLLPRNLQALASLCRKDEGRYALTGVRLITTETGCRAEATDGRMLARVIANHPASPYPMPFVRTKELVGFQRWVIGAYDKRFSWQHWQAADYRPEMLHLVETGIGTGTV